MEKLINTGAGMHHVDFNPKDEDRGLVGNVIIVRPAFLTDGEAKGVENLRKGERVPGAWTISRKDIGLFITKECLDADSKWRCRGVTVSD